MKIKLRDISSLITKGTTPTSIGFNFESQGIKFVKVECFAPDGSFLPSKVVYISECCHEKLKRSQLKENDILFSIAGAIGRVAMVTREMLPCNTNQALAIIRISDKRVYLPYIKHVLSSSYISKQFNKLKQGVAQLNISLTDVGNLVIPLPKYAKQVDITHTLAKIQSIISHRRAQLAKLDELVKCRFVEFFGDPVTNPNQYEIATLESIASYWNGLTYSPEEVAEEGTIVLRSSNIQNSALDFKDTVRVNCRIPAKKYVQENDILMCSRNGSAKLVGKVALIQRIKEAMSFGAFMMIIRSASYYPYLMTYFQMPAFRLQIATGSTTTINQITGNMMDKVKLPIPPVSQVEKFSSFVRRIDKSRFAIQASLDKTQQLFDSLMQEYFG